VHHPAGHCLAAHGPMVCQPVRKNFP
jgi:hypothetical protein